MCIRDSYYVASYVLTASGYRNHLLSYLPLLESYIYKSSSPAFFHSFHSFRSSLSLSVAIASNFTHDGFRSSRKVAAAYQIIFGGRQGALDFIHPEWPRLLVVSKGARELFRGRQPSFPFMTRRWPSGCIARRLWNGPWLSRAHSEIMGGGRATP